MGRNIPAITSRIDVKLAEWGRYAMQLNQEERAAFETLIPIIKNRRTAIDEADEADIGVAILLALVTYIKVELNARNRLPDSKIKNG